MRKINKANIFYLWLLLQPVIDLIVSFTVRNNANSVFTLGVVSRGLFMVILLIVSFFSRDTENKRKMLIYYLIVVIYFVIYLFIRCLDNGITISLFVNEVKFMFKYFYYPFVLISLCNLRNYFNLDSDKVKKILIINLFVISSSILIAYFTHTSFSSYGNDNEGIIGWFYSANEIGAIIIALYSFTFLIKSKRNIPFYVITMMLAITSSMFMGTKTTFFGIILTLVFYVLYLAVFKIKDNVQLKYKIGYVVLSVFLIVILNFNSTALNNVKKTNNDYNNPQIQDGTDNVVVDKVIFSSRLEFLSIDYKIFISSKKINYLFGIGFTGKDKGNFPYEKRSEMDFFDIFLRYGFLGFILYMAPIIVYICRNVRIVISDKFKNPDNVLSLYSLAISFAISFLAGHVLSSPAVSIYLILAAFLVSNVSDDCLDSNLNAGLLKNNKITIMALHLGYGGVEQYISSLCKMLENDFDIEIIVTYKVLEKPAFYFSNNVKISYLIEDKPNKEEFKMAVKAKNIFKVLKEGVKAFKLLYLKRYLNIEAIKKIDSKYVITTRFHSSLVGKYANSNIIKIATEHNYHNNDEVYIKKIVKSVIGFDYLVCVSQELADFYSEKLKTTKCVFIPNVIDSLPSNFTSLKENILISVGRLEPEKGLFDLINVIKEVRKSINDIKLYIIGDGSLRGKLEDLVKKENLGDNICFTGFLSKKELENYFIKSKLFVMTSYTESFGLVLIEAMSYKIPCIAFDSANGAKTILANDVGILVSNRDINRMAKKIVSLLNNDKLIKKYSHIGYNYCKMYLSSNVKKDWIKLLRSAFYER